MELEELDLRSDSRFVEDHNTILGPKLLIPMGCVKLGNQFAVCSPTDGT